MGPRKCPPDVLFLELRHHKQLDQEGTREVNGNSTLNVGVEAGGTQVVAHAGLHALGRFADRIGLPQALSAAVGWRGERAPLHDRGTVLTHAMLMLAGGGEACTDIEFLPASKVEKLTKFGGREKLQERLTAIKSILEER